MRNTMILALAMVIGAGVCFADWEALLTSPTTNVLNDVAFPENNDSGYVVGERGVILKTLNGGITWYEYDVGDYRNVSLNTPINVENVIISSSEHGAYGRFHAFKTINAGAIWEPLFTDLGLETFWCDRFFSHFPTNMSTGFGALSKYSFESLIIKTTDGASSWSIVKDLGSNKPRSICFLNNNMYM